jgi:hypothetical protein
LRNLVFAKNQVSGGGWKLGWLAADVEADVADGLLVGDGVGWSASRRLSVGQGQKIRIKKTID